VKIACCVVCDARLPLRDGFGGTKWNHACATWASGFDYVEVCPVDASQTRRWRHLFARTGLKMLMKLALEFLAEMDTKTLDSGDARNPSSGEDSSLTDLFHSVVPELLFIPRISEQGSFHQRDEEFSSVLEWSPSKR